MISTHKCEFTKVITKYKSCINLIEILTFILITCACALYNIAVSYPKQGYIGISIKTARCKDATCRFLLLMSIIYSVTILLDCHFLAVYDIDAC